MNWQIASIIFNLICGVICAGFAFIYVRKIREFNQGKDRPLIQTDPQWCTTEELIKELQNRSHASMIGIIPLCEEGKCEMEFRIGVQGCSACLVRIYHDAGQIVIREWMKGINQGNTSKQ